MSFPMPSFFKIRFVLLIIGFLFIFLLVGFCKWAVNSCFAACSNIGDVVSFEGNSYRITSTFTNSSSLFPGYNDTCYLDREGLSSGRYYGVYHEVSPEGSTQHRLITYYGDPLSVCEQLEIEVNSACANGCVEGSFNCELQNCDCIPQSCLDAEADCISQSNNTQNCEHIDFGEDANGGCISPSCLCNELPCSQIFDNCRIECGDFGTMENFCFDPGPEDPVDARCICFNPDGNIDNTPDDPDEHGDPADDDDDLLDDDDLEPDPNDLDHDLLSKIVANTSNTSQQVGKVIDNTALIARILDDELNQTNNKLDRIGQSIDGVNRSISGLNSLIETGNESLKNIDDTLVDIADGDYEPGSITNKLGTYNNPAETLDFTPYSNRFNIFVDDIRNSSVFSLTDDILFDIPTGGTAVLAVDLGRFGAASVDFSEWQSQLLILRYAFLTSFSFAGLRILLSKQ